MSSIHSIGLTERGVENGVQINIEYKEDTTFEDIIDIIKNEKNLDLDLRIQVTRGEKKPILVEPSNNVKEFLSLISGQQCIFEYFRDNLSVSRKVSEIQSEEPLNYQILPRPSKISNRFSVKNLKIVNEFGEIHFLEPIDISEDFDNLQYIFNLKPNEISINNDDCKNPAAFNKPARLVFKNFCKDYYIKYEQKRKLTPQELNSKV